MLYEELDFLVQYCVQTDLVQYSPPIINLNLLQKAMDSLGNLSMFGDTSKLSWPKMIVQMNFAMTDPEWGPHTISIRRAMKE